MSYTIEYGGDDGRRALTAYIQTTFEDGEHLVPWFIEVEHWPSGGGPVKYEGWLTGVEKDHGRVSAVRLQPGDPRHDEPGQGNQPVVVIPVDEIGELIVP